MGEMSFEGKHEGDHIGAQEKKRDLPYEDVNFS
jgi:hypothetical protein